jgi:chorismate synthase
MLSINAVKGFEYGSGFAGAKRKGSAHNDLYNEDGTTKTNYSGGVQGGISNGMDIYFNVAFKPVATIMQHQETIDKKRRQGCNGRQGETRPLCGATRRAYS